MYGTVARIQARPGMEQQLIAFSRMEEELPIPGFVMQYVFRMDTNPNDYYLVVMFESREAYLANAASPEQDARYRTLLELLAAEPEWHDGEVVHGWRLPGS